MMTPDDADRLPTADRAADRWVERFADDDAALPIYARRDYAWLFPYEGRVPLDVLAVSRAVHVALGFKHQCETPEMADHECPSDCCDASHHEYEARRLIDTLRDDGWTVGHD